MKAGAQSGDRTANGSAGVALWRRLADDLEQSIVAGTYAAGDRLPGENEIAERFHLNRHTVRRALAELTERGLVRAERGSGTYVESGRLAYPIGARTRFSEILGAVGLSASGRLIASSAETADADIARRLAIAIGDPVIRLEIVRAANRVPVSIATSWMSARQFPEAAQVYRAKHSMTRTLAQFGIHDYRRQSTRVSAAVVDASDAARLRLTPGRLILLVDSEDVARSGTPVVATRARFAADRVELLVES